MIYPESLDVIMGNDKNENFCHFKVKGDLFGESCTIYARDGNIIAKMHKKLTLGNEKYALTVYPNVDQAFVVTLVLLMRLIREIDM
ncbi:putative tubby-like protein [Helianthus annuus]|nr:putative tubby-like protein [Helianthus annuus]